MQTNRSRRRSRTTSSRCARCSSSARATATSSRSSRSCRPANLAREMAERTFLFTSESVTEGHPDKIADQISDAVLDAALSNDPESRVACETLITTGLVVVAGEMTTSEYIDIPPLVRETRNGRGYTRAKYGFH